MPTALKGYGEGWMVVHRIVFPLMCRKALIVWQQPGSGPVSSGTRMSNEGALPPLGCKGGRHSDFHPKASDAPSRHRVRAAVPRTEASLICNFLDLGS
jgi:hypothetical protein